MESTWIEEVCYVHTKECAPIVHVSGCAKCALCLNEFPPVVVRCVRCDLPVIYAWRVRKISTGFLAMFKKHESNATKDYALLYGPVPYYLKGLLKAGVWHPELGRRSSGRMYHRILYGKYPYQRIEGRTNIAKLRAMFPA
jgi:hypothetical protein